MTEPNDSEDLEFSRQLESLFDAPSPGLHDPQLEARILQRIARRRRFQAMILGLGTLTGVAIAVRSLSEARLPAFHADFFFDWLGGNSPINLLYAALGAGGVAPVVIAGGLTLLGLAFVRVLEEV